MTKTLTKHQAPALAFIEITHQYPRLQSQVITYDIVNRSDVISALMWNLFIKRCFAGGRSLKTTNAF